MSKTYTKNKKDKKSHRDRASKELKKQKVVQREYRQERNSSLEE